MARQAITGGFFTPVYIDNGVSTRQAIGAGPVYNDETQSQSQSTVAPNIGEGFASPIFRINNDLVY